MRKLVRMEFLGRFRGVSYYSATHWQCWLLPQIFVTRDSDGLALGFRWLFWGANVAYGER